MEISLSLGDIDPSPFIAFSRVALYNTRARALMPQRVAKPLVVDVVYIRYMSRYTHHLATYMYTYIYLVQRFLLRVRFVSLHKPLASFIVSVVFLESSLNVGKIDKSVSKIYYM